MSEKKATPDKAVEAKKAVSKSNQDVAKAQALTQENAKELREEAHVPVTLAPMYQAYFGDVMTVSLNGLNIYVPINGRTYQIPKSYAMIVQERRRRVDAHVMRAARLSDVSANFEQSPGELTLIPK